jgi:hypothetical protein
MPGGWRSAPLEAIMDALADVKALLSFTPAYLCVWVLDSYDDGRPHLVRLAGTRRAR